jgi:uncharacterized Rmd1/YagE family protein
MRGWGKKRFVELLLIQKDKSARLVASTKACASILRVSKESKRMTIVMNRIIALCTCKCYIINIMYKNSNKSYTFSIVYNNACVFQSFLYSSSQMRIIIIINTGGAC